MKLLTTGKTLVDLKDSTGRYRVPGKNLLLFGGPGIARTFMQAGLIDEYRIKFHPMLVLIKYLNNLL